MNVNCMALIFCAIGIISEFLLLKNLEVVGGNTNDRRKTSIRK